MSTPYAPPAGYGDISFVELVPLALRFLGLGLKLVFLALSYPFSSTKFSLKRVLWRQFVRAICPPSSIRQLQFVCPATGVLYQKYMRSLPNKPPVISENIGDGISLHWMGPKTNKKVMYYLHGGGFVLPAVDGHFYMLDWWRNEAKKRHGIDFSIAVLEYSTYLIDCTSSCQLSKARMIGLINFAPWPTQLVQVAAGLAHLLKEGYDPANITVVGDSVGGHEVIFLLAHLIHGHPAADVLNLEKPLAGAAALSPWLCFGTETTSWKQHGHSDVMPLGALNKWSGWFIKSRTRTDDSYYFEPALAPAEWWGGLEKVAKNVLMAGGASEGMFDDIVTTEKAMEKGAGKQVKLEIFGQEGANHNEALVEFACGDAPGSTNYRMLEWLKEVYA
ncbi:Alpha/Beta hydrolase protein [Cristinia sonorae]|uniref:Alpha/Beta hydrolase protein n=1 Tax=Cristinia sonorae TaxID=1940300 RepID=A0A8K0UW00_9AGAR|nr:Alpha/Beta hydrolase protein [Cristinia sonorae]